MILDDMMKASPHLYPHFSAAHIVRVPFPVGIWNKNYEQYRDGIATLKKMLPRDEQKRVSMDWVRMPYKQIVITSQSHPHERVAVLLLQLDEASGIPGTVQCIQVIGWDDLPHCIVSAVSTIHIRPDGFSEYTLPAELENNAQALKGYDDALREAVKAKEYDLVIFRRLHPDLPIAQNAATFLATVAIATLALLNCKNISTEKTVPNPRLQKRRAQRGELPLLSHHTLLVRPIGKARSESKSGGGQPLAMHWVRGHFKRYTEAAPLLGRHVGCFWFSPHLAGKADRIVTKEYEVGE